MLSIEVARAVLSNSIGRGELIVKIVTTIREFISNLLLEGKQK